MARGEVIEQVERLLPQPEAVLRSLRHPLLDLLACGVNSEEAVETDCYNGTDSATRTRGLRCRALVQRLVRNAASRPTANQQRVSRWMRATRPVQGAGHIPAQPRLTAVWPKSRISLGPVPVTHSWPFHPATLKES